MKVEVKSEYTVGDLIELKRQSILRVNHEYQRGLRWTEMQKRMFIDSIFRGYSIPAFYFHKNEKSAGSITNTYFDIVDGQQRIDAIYSYSEGAFILFDPSDDSAFRFPNFVKDDPCPWGGKRFFDLSEDLKEKLKSQRIVVYEIITTNENKIRDLFIRLQGGTPLTPQDKRDSWPGKFTEFVLRVGGKAGIERWPGDPIFSELSKAGNESRRRQLVAQIFMLFWTVRKKTKFCDIKSSNLDEFYHSQVGFSEDSDEAQRFKRICQELYTAFSGKPRVVGHYLIHLFLLTDSLLDEYVRGTWEAHLANWLNEFERRRAEAAEAEKNRRETEYERYYTEYGRLTQTQSDIANTIRRRHAFFTQEMLILLSPKKLDEKRSFTELERKTVFFRDEESCQYCRMKKNDHKVLWDECEIHHVIPHADGGPTSIDNAALVHRSCHPGIRSEVEKFHEWWVEAGRVHSDSLQGTVRRQQFERPFPPPEATKAKFKYRGQLYRGEIRGGKLILEGENDGYSSFSAASTAVTNKSRNGWTDWFLCFPDSEVWILADEWRKRMSHQGNQMA